MSLESEAAWLRIVFKMFTNGKQSTYKLPTKGLQNLWRVSEEKANEIIEELMDYNICEIQIDGRFIEFTCRRFEKENEISEIRKEAVSNRKDRTKKRNKNLQTDYKTSTKEIQNAEIEIENESEYEDEIKNENENENEKGSVREKTKPVDIIFPFYSENFKANWQLWKTYKSKEHGFKFKSPISEQGSLKKLSELAENNEKTAILIIHQSIENGWKGFFELKNKSNVRNNNTSATDSDHRQSAVSEVGKLFGKQ